MPALETRDAAEGYLHSKSTEADFSGLPVGAIHPLTQPVLIVEFAKERRERGLEIRQAARDAARIRFRPILMTSVAFILGSLPLVIASGAGAASRNSIGTAVVGGMIAVTVLGVLLVPAFYVAVERLGEWRRRRGTTATE